MPVFGSLPFRYRVAVWGAGLATFALLGALAGEMSASTPPWQRMAVLGVALGILAVGAFVRQLRSDPRPVRVPHRRR